MLDAQSVSISIGTAIADIPSRVNALRRDILSVIVVSLSFGPRRVWKALIEVAASARWGSVRRAVTVFQTNVVIKAAAPAVSIELREDRTGPWYRFRDRGHWAPAPGKVRFCSNSGTRFATATLDMATLIGDVRYPRKRTSGGWAAKP